MAPFRVSEWRLARQPYQTLCPEDVVVADSACGIYVDLAGVTAMGADAVFRMWDAVADAEVGALRLSLQGTRQQFTHFRPELLHLSPSARSQGYQALSNAVRELIIPLRPNRSEPRVVKRRPKPFPRMQEPRSILKAKLAA